MRSDVCKCFMYVTKTIANLTTHSRKPGYYNGTIIFEIDMKNSSPLNLKFIFFATGKTKMSLLFWYNQNISIDWVRLFHDVNLKNNGAIVIPRFSTICGQVQTSFGNIGEKFTD